MFNKRIITGLALAGVLVMSMPVFAQTGSTTSTSSAKIDCVKTAVVARETALGAGMTEYTGSMNSAYSSRATALQSAYSQTGDKAIKTALKSAWSAFNTSVRSARSKWSKARTGAWSAYRTSVKACKAPGSISDSSHSGSEVSGN